MNKKEISEIKKQFTPERTSIDRICGCYVDGEKNKKLEFSETFLALPEEEVFKYCDIFRKTLSGTVGKHLLNMEFPLEEESEGGAQHFLLNLRGTQLRDDGLLEDFYDKVIEHYICGEHYLILLIHAVYDIPGKSTGNEEMFDASDEVYDFILCSICPVNLSKAGLCYNPMKNHIEDRIRDWLIEPAVRGFLFPAFNDRSADIHGLLYYSKQPELLQEEFIDQVLGCRLPLTAGGQLETFQSVLTETLGEDCDYETVRNIHENLNEILEEGKESPDPVELTGRDVKVLLEQSGVADRRLESFEEEFARIAGEDQTFLASNLANTRSFRVETPDVVIQVSPARMDLIEPRMVDGRRCIVIPVDERIEVNGINVRTLSEKNRGMEPDEE